LRRTSRFLWTSDAVETVVAGRLQHVDVAYVNDHLFLNNSSIGIYPGVVELREELRRRGHNKWASFAVAIAKTVRRDAELFLQVKIEEHMIETRTPFLFIGNNEYAIEGIRLGSRAALDRGQLFAYLAPRTRTRELPKLLLLALAGQARKHGAFATLESADMWVQTRDNAPLQVSADGEVVILAPPLHYRIAPRALRVIAPTQ
jgi:diacylglycerol kinase family enzyme